MDQEYGGINLKDMKIEEIRMKLNECDYIFEPGTFCWRLNVNLPMHLQDQLGNNQSKDQIKNIVEQTKAEIAKLQKNKTEMINKIEDMKKKLEDGEVEFERLQNEYAIEYLEADKIQAAKEKLANLRKELGI